jgi:hypothetical protein
MHEFAVIVGQLRDELGVEARRGRIAVGQRPDQRRLTMGGLAEQPADGSEHASSRNQAAATAAALASILAACALNAIV